MGHNDFGMIKNADFEKECECDHKRYQWNDILIATIITSKWMTTNASSLMELKYWFYHHCQCMYYFQYFSLHIGDSIKSHPKLFLSLSMLLGHDRWRIFLLDISMLTLINNGTYNNGKSCNTMILLIDCDNSDFSMDYS